MPCFHFPTPYHGVSRFTSPKFLSSPFSSYFSACTGLTNASFSTNPCSLHHRDDGRFYPLPRRPVERWLGELWSRGIHPQIPPRPTLSAYCNYSRFLKGHRSAYGVRVAAAIQFFKSLYLVPMLSLLVP